MTEWIEYSSRIIATLKLKQTAKGEWHGACPNCGGKDRFWIKEHHGEVKLHCRQCDDFKAIRDSLRDQDLLPKFERSLGALPVEPDLADFQGARPYHERKQIGLHQAALEGDVVVVPMRNLAGDIVGHQRIMPDGSKRWTPGMTFDEPVFHVVGSGQTVPTYICEGWADAASLHEATGMTAIFACSANHLPIVAKALNASRPDTLTIAADYDKPGLKAVVEAGLPFVLPPKGSDWNDLYRSGGAESVVEALDHTFGRADASDMLEALQGAPSTSEATPPSAFQFTQVGTLQYRAPEYVIDGLLETETLGLIFGDPGCGKSFLAVDIAASVASGTPFHGRASKKGSVFFIAGEGHNGLARRFKAWSQERSVSLENLPLFKSERAAQFLDAASAAAVAQAVEALAAEHGEPALIIVDTLARNFGAGDENNTRDMSEFVSAIDDLKARFPGCSVLIVHHSGHAEKQRARGAMALKGALDAEYRVEKADDVITMTCTKMKDAEPPHPTAYRFKQVDLLDASSAALELTDMPERKKGLTQNQRLAIDTYLTAALKHGVWEAGVFRGVKLCDWREVFYAKHTGDTPSAKRQAFNRARKDLDALAAMKVRDDIYLTTDPAIQLEILSKRDKRDVA